MAGAGPIRQSFPPRLASWVAVLAIAAWGAWPIQVARAEEGGGGSPETADGDAGAADGAPDGAAVVSDAAAAESAPADGESADGGASADDGAPADAAPEGAFGTAQRVSAGAPPATISIIPTASSAERPDSAFGGGDAGTIAVTAAPPDSARRLKISGLAGASGTYFSHNDSTPVDPTGQFLPPSRGLGRAVVDWRLSYAPWGEARRISLQGEGFLICSKEQDHPITRDSCVNRIIDLHAVAESGDYGFVLGRRTSLQSVGYFRYPLDFYDTRSVVTTGAEDPRYQAENRTGPILAHAERRWDGGALVLEYIPRLPWQSDVHWQTNDYHELVQRLRLLVRDLGVVVAASESLGRDEAPLAGAPPLRERNVVQAGASVTYVVGQALELHGEGAYRHDRHRPQVALDPSSGGLPTWESGAEGSLAQVLVGGQYTFGEESPLRQINIIAEYYFQNEGWNSSDWDRYFGALDLVAAAARGGAVPPGAPGDAQERITAFGLLNGALLNQQPAFWGRHYGFVRVARSNLFVDGVELSAFTLFNVPDHSVASGLGLLAALNSVQVRLSARSFLGPAESEFGRLPDRFLFQVDLFYVF